MLKNDESVKTKTIPEIFKKVYGEEFLTLWLAYILENNPFLVNVFLGENTSNFDFKNLKYKVQVNKKLKNDKQEEKFIDLFIESDNIVIAIENKVLAGLSGEEQLKNYNEGINNYLKTKGKNGSDIQVERILLRPSFNKTVSDNKFRVLTYENISDFIKNNFENQSVISEESKVQHYHLSDLKKHIDINLTGNLSERALESYFSGENLNTEFENEIEYNLTNANLLAKLTLDYLINKIKEFETTNDNSVWKVKRLNSSRQDYVLFYESDLVIKTPKYNYSAIHYELNFGQTTKESPCSDNAVVRVDFELDPTDFEYSEKLALELLPTLKEIHDEKRISSQIELIEPTLDSNNEHHIVVSNIQKINYNSFNELKESLDKIIETLKYVVAIYNEGLRTFISDKDLLKK